MKISGSRPVQSSPVRRKDQATKNTGSGFASALRDNVPVQGAGPAGDVSPVSALLTVQEVGDADGRRRSLLHGHDVLDRLDELRHGLLAGTFPSGKLDELLRVVRIQHERAVDPQLRDVLREIELRASVELAKLRRLG
jgi:hypothetical protein